MLLFIICEAPQKISTIFKPILAIFTLFHLKNLLYLQKPELGNLAKTRFWLLLVNNSLCSIPLSYARSYIKQTPGDRCDTDLLPDLTAWWCGRAGSWGRRGGWRGGRPSPGSCRSEYNPCTRHTASIVIWRLGCLFAFQWFLNAIISSQIISVLGPLHNV